ncbi:MAG: hypothetical protein M3Z03_07690, partial [Actinomycetota bacterium]|nr:hypothetical protein [Actinomycetota bacterium]
MSDQDPPWRAATDVEVTPDFGPEDRAGRAGPDRERGASPAGATAGDLARVREQVTDLREELTARLDEIEVGVRAVVDDRLTALSASLRAELKHRIGAFSDGTSRAIDDLTDEVRARVVGELGSLVAALDADGDGLAGRLLAHQDAWERQAEVRVEANTRRVDEVISVLEQTSGALASVQQAVVGLNQQITAVSAHVSGSTAETSRLLAEQ